MNQNSQTSDSLRSETVAAADSLLTFEVYNDIERFRSLRPEWAELYARANGEYFQSFDYCYSSLVADDATARRKLHCIVGRRRGRLVAVWPLVTSYKSYWKLAEPLTPPNRSPSDILVGPEGDSFDIVKAAWHKAVRTTRADAFELCRVRKSSPLYRYLSANSMIKRELEDSTPFAQLRSEHDWKAFCRSRPGREKTAPDYLRRRLAKHGESAVEVLTASDERLLPLVEWFVAQKRKWASQKNIQSQWTHADACLNFWREILLSPPTMPGIFQLFVLNVEGQPAAANIVATTATCAYLVAITYDLTYGKLSPGTVLVDECVKWAFQRRLDFDFGPGEQRYKTSWSNGEKYATSSFIVLPTRWGQVGFTGKQFVKRMRAIAMPVANRVSPRANGLPPATHGPD